MFKFKKLMSSIVAICVTTAMLATTAFAAIPSDVKDTEFEEAAQVLGALNIMVGDAETGEFRPNDPIIRSEATKVGIALMGLTDVAQSAASSTKYPDVPANHWASGFINVATDQKLVQGDDVGTFRPNAQIKYSEAVAIMIRALGYEPQAIAKGGYPSGYMVTASNIGLTKGVAGSANQLIDRGTVAKMAYNALTINLMEQTGFGTNVSYEVVDKTLLADRLDVKLIEGTVLAVGTSSITGEAKLEKDEIQIGEKIYKTGIADVRTILGFSVEAYIYKHPKTNKETLLLAVPVSGANNTVSISSENIDTITNEDGVKSINYWKNPESDKKSTKASIAADAKVMYNGKNGTFEDFKVIKSGNIVLLDSDNNGIFDIVFVNETKNYVVEEVVTTTHKIIDKYGNKTLVLDPEDEDLTFHLTNGSQYVELSSLKEWDVITLTISKDGTLIYGEVSTNSVSGTVTETDDEKVFIDGKGYYVASNYQDTIKLLDEGTFYLDAEGKIAAVDSKTTISSNYAYIENIGLSSGLDKVIEFKLFTKSGETVTLQSASKIRVNEKTNLTPADALEEIKGKRENAKGQLITFEKNSDGKITKVSTYEKTSSIDEDKFTLNMDEKGAVYNASSSKLVGKDMSVNITDSTIIFDIPSTAKDSDDYSIRDKSFFVNENEYDVLVFNVTEDYNAKVVIVTSSTGVANEESSIAVVDKITTMQNKDGNTVEKLYAFMDGKEVSFVTTEDDILVKDGANGKVALANGDIIQFKTNAANEIDSVTVLHDISKADEYSKEHSDNMKTVFGKVTKKFSQSFNLQAGDGAIENYAFGDSTVYVLDTNKSTKKITVGDFGDIQKYDEAAPEKVFVRIYKDVVKEIVVIK